MMPASFNKDVFIGTSGFSYPYWKNRFYPENLPSSKWLEYYCTRFNTLELNNSFYRFPRAATLEKIYERTPPGFVLSIKAHKIITHSMRMKNAAEKVHEFSDVVYNSLQEKAACILFQLPPTFRFSEENLENIITSVGSGSRNIIEFRHESWWTEEVYQALKASNLTFCNVSYPGLPEDFVMTSDVFYLRMHGVPKLFVSSYGEESLHRIREHIPQNAKKSYIYFNNTTLEGGYSNAAALQALFGM